MGEARENKRLHVLGLLSTAVALGLEGAAFVNAYDIDTLVREYNGIGPEWAGQRLRATVTQHLGLFEPAALIHDLRNYESDGSRAAFEAANREFLHNCLKLVDVTYPWYRPRRYVLRGIAISLYDFVQGPGGWAAWHDCHERRLNNQASRIS